MKACGVAFLVFLYMLVETRGDYRLEIRIDKYKNPSHFQADGRCCHYRTHSRSYRRCTDCSNRFTFCIRSFESEPSISGLGNENIICSGTRGSYITGIVGQNSSHLDDLSFEGLNYIDYRNNVTNPLIFNSSEAWPGNFQFIAVIENWRSVFYTHNIDVIIFDWILPLNIEFIQKTLKGIRGNSILTVSVRVLCTNGLLCQNCTQICDLTSAPETPGMIKDIVNANETIGNDTSSRIGDSNRGTIIGLTVGGSLLLILLLIIGITLSILCMKKRSDSIKKNEQQPFLPNKPDEDSEEDGFTYSTSESNIYEVPPFDDNSNKYLDVPATKSHSHRNKVQNAGRGHKESTGGPVANNSPIYSVIMKRNISSTNPLSDIDEVSDGEETDRHMHAGYSIIKKENMDDAAYSIVRKKNMDEAGYSIIRKENMDDSDYSVITKENMDGNLSEAVSEEDINDNAVATADGNGMDG